jgi:hypothetical protein
MTTSTLTLTEAARRNIQLDPTPGPPKLPHIPENWGIKLTPQQQKENLLHVALWIVERDLSNFEMKYWHLSWLNAWGGERIFPTTAEEGYNKCGTVHCITGFAQVMAGEVGFTDKPVIVGLALLGYEAASHFMDTNKCGLAFLKEVIARNSWLL